MIRHNFFLPEDLMARMKQYSERTGVSLSEIVRRAIFAWLKEHERV
jgi:predicted DNA-binding protein